MVRLSPDARDERLRAAKRSPELANLHDRRAWLALYSRDASVEDPVGTPPCTRGVFTRPGKADDLERFYDAFIASCAIRVEERLDVVVGDTVVRDVVLHVQLPGGGRGAIAAILEYDFVRVDGALRVRRMRAYWDAGKNGRAMMRQGLRGQLTSILSGFRLLRFLGSDWTKRYLEGTKRGLRREGPPLVEALGAALAANDAAALARLATSDATVVLPGEVPRPLATFDARPLALSFGTPTNSGFVATTRLTARIDGADVEGIAFVEVEPSTKRITTLRLFWEPR